MKTTVDILKELKNIEERRKESFLAAIITFSEQRLTEGQQIDPKIILENYSELVEEFER